MVCINRFNTDTQAELDLCRSLAKEQGAFDVAVSEHWGKGGPGAAELSTHVIRACKESRAEGSPYSFKFLYELESSIEDKIRAVALSYGADDIEISEEAKI